MTHIQVWLTVATVLILLEFIVPGGIVIFPGMASLLVALALYVGWVTTVPMALTVWFLTSIVLMLFLRSVFIKYFEGDISVQNVDEDIDLKGSLVDVIEVIHPYKEGRVRLRDATWMARSEDEIKEGNQAVVVGRDGNRLIVKPL